MRNIVFFLPLLGLLALSPGGQRPGPKPKRSASATGLPVSGTPPVVTLSKATLQDKIKGGWAGLS